MKADTTKIVLLSNTDYEEALELSKQGDHLHMLDITPMPQWWSKEKYNSMLDLIPCNIYDWFEQEVTDGRLLTTQQFGSSFTLFVERSENGFVFYKRPKNGVISYRGDQDNRGLYALDIRVDFDDRYVILIGKNTIRAMKDNNPTHLWERVIDADTKKSKWHLAEHRVTVRKELPSNVVPAHFEGFHARLRYVIRNIPVVNHRTGKPLTPDFEKIFRVCLDGMVEGVKNVHKNQFVKMVDNRPLPLALHQLFLDIGAGSENPEMTNWVEALYEYIESQDGDNGYDTEQQRCRDKLCTALTEIGKPHPNTDGRAFSSYRMIKDFYVQLLDEETKSNP